MKGKIKYILIALAAIVVLGSIFGPKKNVGDQLGENAISTKYDVPAEVGELLSRACMDCHSNNTKYPWYSKVFPSNWYLYNHVFGGKKHLNFSEFASYPPKKAAHKLEEIIEVLDSGEMPLKSYVLLHQEAKLTADERAKLKSWAQNLKQSIVVE